MYFVLKKVAGIDRRTAGVYASQLFLRKADRL
jgi:hypothetical protein